MPFILASPLILVPSHLWIKKSTSEKHVENLIWVNILLKMLLSKPSILPWRLIVSWLLPGLIIIPLLFWVCQASIGGCHLLKGLSSLWRMVFVRMELYGEFFIRLLNVIF
jgi:hypothetical protein